jgi:hypothetical protein
VKWAWLPIAHGLSVLCGWVGGWVGVRAWRGVRVCVGGATVRACVRVCWKQQCLCHMWHVWQAVAATSNPTDWVSMLYFTVCSGILHVNSGSCNCELMVRLTHTRHSVWLMVT